MGEIASIKEILVEY